MNSSVQVTVHFMLTLFSGRAKFIIIPFHHVHNFPIGNAPATTHSSSSCSHYSYTRDLNALARAWMDETAEQVEPGTDS